MLPLYGAAPDYLLRGLQVQQMSAARAVLGPRSLRWSNQKILSFLGWLNIKQQYAFSTLILTHKIVTTGRPMNIFRSMVTPYPYQTRRATQHELRAWSGTVGGRNRTALTTRTFQFQAISLYNRLPMNFRGYSLEQFKSAAKKWARNNIL